MKALGPKLSGMGLVSFSYNDSGSGKNATSKDIISEISVITPMTHAR